MLAFLSHVDINTIILTIVGGGLAIQQWRNGTTKISSETVQAYKDQLEIMEKRFKDQTETLNQQAGQIGELKGLLSGKDKQIEEYRQIIENRNPQLEQILTKVAHFMEVMDSRLQAMEEHQKRPVSVETTITKQ